MHNINLRVDGNSGMGLGHIYRCISLAQMLEKKYSIKFWSKEIPDHLATTIRQNGYYLEIILTEDDFIENIDKNSIVITDGYHFDKDYQEKVKEKGSKLICIDDIHQTYFKADAVINHAAGISKSQYRGDKCTKYFLGPDYALLRPNFLKKAKVKNTLERLDTDSLTHLFVCIGGADPKNLSSYIIQLAEKVDFINQISIVTGSGYRYKEELNRTIQHSKLTIHWFSELKELDMINVIENCDFALVPASTILYEIIGLRLPVLTGYFVENQKDIYFGFLETDCVIGVGQFHEDQILSGFNELLNSDLLQVMNNQIKCIDGYSDLRINKILNELV